MYRSVLLRSVSRVERGGSRRRRCRATTARTTATTDSLRTTSGWPVAGFAVVAGDYSASQIQT